MNIDFPSRSENAKKVLDEMLEHKQLTQKDITHLANLEDSGRIIDHIRWKLLVPIECDKRAEPTVWYIEEKEIYKYHHDRTLQIEEQTLRSTDSRLDKIVAWSIQIAKTECGRELVCSAMDKINQSMK